jgi:SAM-dependent MidA family methyltransferase
MSTLSESFKQWLNTPRPFDEVMHRALLDPTDGYYYRNVWQRDFITSAQLPSFSWPMAQYFLPWLYHHPDWSFVMVGGGDGQLMRRLYDVLWVKHGLKNPIIIWDASAHHVLKQQALLPSSVTYTTHCPSSVCAVWCLCEVLDALPVVTLSYQNDQLHERYVVMEGDQATWYQQPLRYPWLANTLHCFSQHWSEGYQTEYCVALQPFLKNCMAAHAGHVWLLDYTYDHTSYYHPERFNGTLRAYDKHHCYADVLPWLGCSDLTATVSRTNVLNVFQGQGAVSQWSYQADFCLAHQFLEGNPWPPTSSDMKQLLWHMHPMFQVLSATWG